MRPTIRAIMTLAFVRPSSSPASPGDPAPGAAAAVSAPEDARQAPGRSIAGIDLSRLVNVRAKGAKGNGTADDTAAFKAALATAARKGTGVYVPAGTYRVSRLALPNRIVLAGAGRSKAWIKGGLSFGSRTTVADLKIGDRGVSIRNLHGASYTAFKRCRLRGGGGWGGDAPVLMLGNADGKNSLHHVTFSRCQIERSLGVEDWSGNGHGRGYNNVTVNENAAAGGSHIEYLSFIRCHVGVSNGSGGHDTGSPRAGIEVWSSSPRTIAQGWHHLVIKGCTFEDTLRDNVFLHQ